MQCLLEVLRGSGSSLTVDETEWQLAIDLAEEHHILPFIAETLLPISGSLPLTIQARLAQAKREALHYSFLQSAELRHLLQAFTDGGLPVIPLKGLLLARRVYGSVALRISCDHDLLVQRIDFARASLLLQTLGFTPDTMPDDYHQKWSRGTTIVELHFDVENPLAINFNVKDAWKNARQAEFGGQPTWQLAPRDELRYLCLHGVRHRFSQLSHVLDISLAAMQLGKLKSITEPKPERLDDTNRVLLLGCAMASRLHPQGPELLSHRYSSNLERLADKLWADLLARSPIQQNWASMHRFYLETEPNALARFVRRILHLRILLTRLIDDDFRFAARFGLKRPWQVWLLRPARLALRATYRALNDTLLPERLR